MRKKKTFFMVCPERVRVKNLLTYLNLRLLVFCPSYTLYETAFFGIIVFKGHIIFFKFLFYVFFDVESESEVSFCRSPLFFEL